MTNQNNSDSIYLEPGSVWWRGDEWRQLRDYNGNMCRYKDFSWSKTYVHVSMWLTWAKHPDTVLVYPPSRNKLPPKPGYVRVTAPYVVDEYRDVSIGDPHQSIDEYRRIWPAKWGLFGVVTFDARLPTVTEPDEVEGVVSE